MAPLKRNNKSNGGDRRGEGKECNIETDPQTLARRQKQIDYGKVTKGYQNYLTAVPKEKRTPKQPKTPDKYQVCSRRSFDGQIRLWRLLLHAHDDERKPKSSEDKTDEGARTGTDRNNNWGNEAAQKTQKTYQDSQDLSHPS